MSGWNPWHGCTKYSPGCLNCYVYRRDAKYDMDASQVRKNADFDLPLRKKRDGSYKIAPHDTVETCFTSDFFLDKADEWRADAWRMMKIRSDLNFFFITKRILRFNERLPDDWGEGYPNVTIALTCENQRVADERVPFYLSLPIRHKLIVCEPMLERIDLEKYLCPQIELVSVGGESGNEARLMRCEWVLDMRAQCARAGIPFQFRQTGARFEKDGRLYRVPRKYQHIQARKSGLSTYAYRQYVFEGSVNENERQ